MMVKVKEQYRNLTTGALYEVISVTHAGTKAIPSNDVLVHLKAVSKDSWFSLSRSAQQYVTIPEAIIREEFIAVKKG